MASSVSSLYGVSPRLHPARVFCMIFAPALVLFGALGFIQSTNFHTGQVVHANYLLFDVNGWSNVVHIVLGLLLARGARNWKAGRTAAQNFGLVMLVFAVIGLIDGGDVLGWFPVNPGTCVLYLVLGFLALAVSLAPAPAKTRAVRDSTGGASVLGPRSLATGPSTAARADALARGPHDAVRAGGA